MNHPGCITRADLRLQSQRPDALSATRSQLSQPIVRLGQQRDQPVVIDNKPGAVEILAATVVAQAKPDGFTLLPSTDAALETKQFLFSKLPYDPSKDLTPIMHLVDSPFVYVVNSDSPHRTMHDLLAAATEHTSGLSRLRVLPQVATLEELGYDDMDVKIMFGLSGPANLPSAIANMIARDVAQVLKEPDFMATSLDPFGLVPVGNSPAEFARFLLVDREKQRVRVKAANVRLD